MARTRAVTYKDENGNFVSSEIQDFTAQEETDRDAEELENGKCVKVSWDVAGNGTENADGVYELTADGSNKAIAKLEAWDGLNDVALTSVTDSYWVKGNGANPSSGKITMVAGVATVDFVPGALDEKGVFSVSFEVVGSGKQCFEILRLGIE